MIYLDWLDYAENLLGPADWTDAASVAGLYAKAQALLPSDLLVLPVARIAVAHVAADAVPRSAIAAKPAAAEPLRTLLASATLRAMLAETLTRLDASRGPSVLALGLAAPAEFARHAAAAAGLTEPVADDDLADDAAVYIADFLRAFATAPLKAILLSSDSAFAGFAAPIVRVAEHYGWRVIRETDFGTSAIRHGIIPIDTRPEDAADLARRLRASEGRTV